MKRKNLLKTAVLAAAMLALCACGNGAKAETETTVTETAAESETETTAAAAESSVEETEGADVLSDETTVRVGSLKGPTTIGLVNMMEENEEGRLPFAAEFSMAAAADEMTAKLVGGDVDIALIPANLAAVLYQKTEGGISVIDINTLGVLYGVTGDESVQSLSDLAGKTVYMTGQGTTPEYAFEYILAQNGLSDQVTLEFKSEATEIAALLKEDPSGIAVLPQPFATVVQQQNESVKQFLDLTEEWKKCADSGASELVTGVTVVRSEFLSAHEELVNAFVQQHEASALSAMENVDQTAELVAKYGIIEKAPIAKLAIPSCNIVCITGAEMQDGLSGYLDVLYQANPKSVGGALPGDDFYAFIEEK